MIKAFIQKAVGKRATPDISLEDIPRYPPYVKGLPAASVDDLLASQRELITRISYTTRYDEAHFLQWYYPAIRRYARFVHLLPASETHHHRGIGGLLRHGLEASQEALSRITNGGAALGLDVLGHERRRIAPVWELAAFLAGLMHDMGKAVTDMKVTSMNGRHTWDPYQADLVEWLRSNKIDRYCVRFNQGPRHKAHELCTALVVNYVLTDDLKSYISQTAPGVLEKLLAAVTGTVMGRNIIHDYMLHADQKSVEQDLKTNRLEPGINSEVGIPVERNLIDAMRRLVKDGTWKPNTPGNCLWMINNSLFVAWRRGAEDVTRSLSQHNIPGIPRDPDVLADILIERDLVKPCLVDGQTLRYWKISPEILQKEGEKHVEIRVLRMTSPELIIDPPPPSIAGLILSGGQPKSPIPPLAVVPPQTSRPSSETRSENPPPIAIVPSAAKAGPVPPEIPEPNQTVQIPPPVDEPWNFPGAVKLNLEEPLPADQDDEGGEASAELILPEELGGDPPKKKGGVQKKLKKSGSPAERMALTASLIEVPWMQQEDVQEDAAERVACAIEFFDQSLAGSVLHAIASDLARGKAHWGKEAITVNELVAIRYPEGFAGQGCDPRELLEAMAADGWVAIDPHAPLRKVQEVNGFTTGKSIGIRKAVVLEGVASQPFLVIARAAPEPVATLEPELLDGKHLASIKALPEVKSVAPAPDRALEPFANPKAQASAGVKVESKIVQSPKRDSSPDRALLALIGAENSPFQTTQLGGKFYIQHDDAFNWLMKERGLSLAATRKILGSGVFASITEKGTKLLGPA